MKIFIPFILLAILHTACEKETTNEKDTQPPLIQSIQPENNATGVLLDSEIFIEYNENILLNEPYTITINNEAKTASVDGKKLIIEETLQENTTYNVFVSNNSVIDQADNYADEANFSFKTIDNTIYEAEEAEFSSSLTVGTDISGYSGTGYVTQFTNSTDFIRFNLVNMSAGLYNLYIGFTTSGGAKVCKVFVNGTGGDFELSASSSFIKKEVGKVKLVDGDNLVEIVPNWTYFSIDYIQLVPNTEPIAPFNIDANLVTATPSPQAVNVYNFLKDNFQQKVISGTMAAHSTNIDEAIWVHDQTGKWPALTGFDFIDHNWPNQNWVDYDGPITLGTDWWNNNGLITLTWHWRDPLNIGGEFYTKSNDKPDGTEFDISKITDVNSAEYMAMVEDIDEIAAYLQEFKDANIPVLWRPLHEAAGGWFWWGAKGAAPCKALWQLMFDRLVNHHGLNNLIWVWTSDVDEDALEWYPGHDYVDIIGMDIYPGENQHGSQYISFDKVKEIFEVRKIIALTECGSVPDPALMKEYGDMWSWFMPWNGDYTRADEHNGATWWDTFFSYDYVITRDQMPDLK